MKPRLLAIAAVAIMFPTLPAVVGAGSVTPDAKLKAAKCVPTVPVSGEVLIAGGLSGVNFDIIADAELFDPATQTFKSACKMKAKRAEALPLVVPGDAKAKVANHILFLGGETPGKKFEKHPKTTDSYDPATGKFKKGPGMKQVAEDGAVVKLIDGRFLILAGETSAKSGDVASKQAMIFNPATGKFTKLKSTMTTARKNPGAALVGGGKVLIAGGTDEHDAFLQSAELFDPATNAFAATGNMHVGRQGLTATALNDGTVLIAGGFDQGAPQPGDTTTTAEIFDPTSGTFTLTSALFGGTGSDMDQGRAFHTATKLNDGTVLLAGGEQDIQGAGDHTIGNASIYDPSTGVFTPTANDMSDSREDHSATLIANSGTALDGQVLIAGGEDFDGSDVLLDTAALYNPATHTFTATTGVMSTGRSEHAAALIP
jgi:hypothetical protein